MRASVEERRDKILHEVMTNGEATVSELADLLGVTTETIRKDLATLEEKNVISKGHGFVTLSTAPPETDFSQRETMRKCRRAFPNSSRRGRDSQGRRSAMVSPSLTRPTP